MYLGSLHLVGNKSYSMASAPPSLRGGAKSFWKNFLGGPGNFSKIRGGAEFLGGGGRAVLIKTVTEYVENVDKH